ncbi:hypothetical protein DPMN_122116 [Dreissena polymorpha]|uniref:Uncharacterized protein n=1 Tax=Dreissena polymorpha TaxID=45954 RepID=A0A9D4JQ37_DREPO|nr:hypothetical protein DPMN_122116 [Dreissena polymorpha]
MKTQIPDLILVKNKTTVLIDPTIVMETKLGIRKANEEKVNKYQHLIPNIQNLYKVDKVEVKGLAI